MKSYIAYVAERGKVYPTFECEIQAYNIEHAEIKVMFNLYPRHPDLELRIIYITEVPA